MAEFLAVRDEAELDALEGATSGPSEALPGFEITYAPETSGDTHTKNRSDNDLQRKNVVQRQGSAYVRCSCVDVVHGNWDPEYKATLVVLAFRFEPRKPGRRVTFANLSFEFFDAQGDSDNNPEVAKISFDGRYSLVPTTRKQSTTKGADGTVGGGAFGLEISSTLKWERTVEEEVTDAAYLCGSIDCADMDGGPENAASWILSENATTKSGIPAALRVGILLKRETDDDFHCKVKVSTKADLKTRLGEYFSTVAPDDPILFKTSLPPTKTLKTYGTDALGQFDLSEIEDVTFETRLGNTIKSVG